MVLTESINRSLLKEGESLYNRILDVVADREIHDEDLVLAVGDDAIRIRNEKTNKEVWIKPEDNDDGIESKIMSTFNKTEESEGLEEDSNNGLVDDLFNKFVDYAKSNIDEGIAKELADKEYNEEMKHQYLYCLTNFVKEHKDEVYKVQSDFIERLKTIEYLNNDGVLKAIPYAKESEELEEASLWDSLPDEFKGKIAGANEIVSKLQSVQGVNATAEVSGNNLTLTLTGDLLKAMDAVDTIRAAAEGKGLKVNANYGEKNFIVTITQ